MERKNNPELGEALRSLAIRHYSQIADIVDKGDLTSWFRAFMKSHEFEVMSAEMKVDTFDLYYVINRYLNELFELIDKAI